MAPKIPATAALFLEHASPERFRAYLGRPIKAVWAELQATLGSTAFEILSSQTRARGIPPRTRLSLHPYASDLKPVSSMSLTLTTEARMKDGIAPAPFVDLMLATWTTVKAGLAERVGPLTEGKTLYPQKRPVGIAAPALKAALHERHDFGGGTLVHHAVTGPVLFTYTLALNVGAG